MRKLADWLKGAIFIVATIALLGFAAWTTNGYFDYSVLHPLDIARYASIVAWLLIGALLTWPAPGQPVTLLFIVFGCLAWAAVGLFTPAQMFSLGIPVALAFALRGRPKPQKLVSTPVKFFALSIATLGSVFIAVALLCFAFANFAESGLDVVFALPFLIGAAILAPLSLDALRAWRKK